MLILIKSAGDLASGVAVKLYHCGYQIIMTEIGQPTTVRCEVSFSRVVYQGSCQLEGVTARHAVGLEQVRKILDQGEIPVYTGPAGHILHEFRPQVLIDAIIAKHNSGTRIDDAPLTIALGPGFTAGVDCHAVIETMRGHDLGRVLYQGQAYPNTGVPGEIDGHGSDRILRSCHDGVFQPIRKIGDSVNLGDIVAHIGEKNVYAQVSGVIRGLLPAGTPVSRGMKSGDIDPRGRREYCFSISDKARNIAGGVLEAILRWQNAGADQAETTCRQ